MWVENPETAERERRAVEMRTAGATYREIGEELGVNPSSAFRMVRRALDRVPAEAVGDLRSLQLVRLEELWRKLAGILEEAADNPERQFRTIDTMLKVLVREARLMGLDAPPKRVVEVVTDELLQKLIAEERRAIAAQQALLDSLGDDGRGPDVEAEVEAPSGEVGDPGPDPDRASRIPGCAQHNRAWFAQI